VQVTSAVVDVDAMRISPGAHGQFSSQLGGNDPLVVRTAFDFPATTVESVDVQNAEWETSQHLKEEEFTRAEAARFVRLPAQEPLARFVVSLSGGADSAACACLVHLMCALGLARVGARNSRAD